MMRFANDRVDGTRRLGLRWVLLSAAGMLIVMIVAVHLHPYMRSRRSLEVATEVQRRGGRWAMRGSPPWPLTLLGERYSMLFYHLAVIDLSECNVEDADLTMLKGIGWLEALDLSHTSISDAGLEHLSGLSRLRFLSVSKTRVTDVGLASLGPLRRLESLTVSYTRVTDAGLVHIKCLPALRCLDLIECRVTDEGLKHVGGMGLLERLWLNRTDVTDAGVEQLKGMRELKLLGLSGTKVSIAGVRALQRELPQARVKGPGEPCRPPPHDPTASQPADDEKAGPEAGD